MELEVTHMVNDADMMPNLFGSRMELGDDAANITWDNAKEYGKTNPLVTRENLEQVYYYFKEFGSWTREEMNRWSLEEWNAILIQDIAASIREMENFYTLHEYFRAAEQGTVSGNLFRDGNNRWFFYVGH